MKALSDVKLSYVIRKIKETFSLKGHTHEFVENSSNANKALYADEAGSVEKLKQSRNISINLASTAPSEGLGATAFDGSEDVTIKPYGVLPIKNGGTGVQTLDALIQLITGGYGVHFKVGSYKGEGRWGEDNPTTLEVEFMPKLMIVWKADSYGEVNIIPFKYDPEAEHAADQVWINGAYVCAGNRYEIAAISGSWTPDGILSWWIDDAKITVARVNLNTGLLRGTDKIDMTDNDKSRFQLDHAGSTYWYYIFG